MGAAAGQEPVAGRRGSRAGRKGCSMLVALEPLLSRFFGFSDRSTGGGRGTFS